ncbi:glycosyltransferase family protein [Niabella hibiscisoli]|uniref:hypothetical protein n=1 Tax=Niabella hibiscisoli TaxID=1825928 RepID=UPI001F0E145F|nr:hypothetical protein [Niabella hibiscisoli]MCH5716522.1 hypothetical protein [Niabella hibiscisoli]
MAIILDTDGLTGETYRGYLQKLLFTKLAASLTGEQFIGTSATGTQDLATGTNAGDLPAQKGLFYQRKTEKWLEQLNASIFISFKRMLKTNYPLKQVLIIAGEEQLHDEKMVRSATAIGIVSAGLHQVFSEKYPDLLSKTIRINGILDERMPVYTTIDDIRETVASGREYFILADFNLTPETLTTLLKGFSAFKKMLHSSWKFMLVLRSEETIRRMDVEQLLSNYKYREDIIVTNEDLLAEKLRDAYVLVSMDGSERLPLPVIEASRGNTPVIAPETLTLKQIFGDTIVYPENNTSEAIGKMLMKMYKDENFRQAQKKKLENRSLSSGWEDTMLALSRLLRIESKEG